MPGNKKTPEKSEEMEEEVIFKTAPFDPRFPSQNQTKYCAWSYIEHHRCVKLRGEDFKPCEYFKRVYTSLCPHNWVNKWDRQRDEGNFAAQMIIDDA